MISIPHRSVGRGGTVIRVGGRAFDILLALAERPGEVLSSRHLMARVWPDRQVDEANLRINITALRKALGVLGNVGIVNVPGRGYALTEAAVILDADVAPDRVEPQAAASQPPAPERIVGRNDVIEELDAYLASRRFVTVTGPGGIGKTTVVTALLAALADRMPTTIIELGLVTSPDLILPAFATGLSLSAPTSVDKIVDSLRSKGGVLVLDSCEHLVDGVASLAEELFHQVGGLYILATSRDPLRVDGEAVYRLPALSCPPSGEDLDATRIRGFPAVQLFLKCAAAVHPGFSPADEAMPLVAHICRRLDGLPLALELAASRMDAHTLSGLSELLDDRFAMLLAGRRTALPRHRTLKATIDWSHDLLSAAERAVFRRLAVFPGVFDLGSARAVAGWDQGSDLTFMTSMMDLVAKSLIASTLGPHGQAYRLLDTMRAYASEQLRASGEGAEIYRRLTERLIGVLEGRRRGSGSSNCPLSLLDSVRDALAWAFSEAGDAGLGSKLAQAALPLFFEHSLMDECARWADRVYSGLSPAARREAAAVDVLRFSGTAAMFALGNMSEAQGALEAARDIATGLGDPEACESVEDGLFIFHLRAANYAQAMAVAAGRTGRGSETTEGLWKLGISQHFVGAHDRAVELMEEALGKLEPGSRADIARTGIDRRVHVLAALCRSRWAIGDDEDALATARRTVAEAEALDHPVSLCIALTWTAPVFVWAGQPSMAAQLTARLVALGERHGLGPYRMVGTGLRGGLLAMSGKPREGAAILRNTIDELLRVQHRMSHPVLLGHLSEAYAEAGLAADGLQAVEKALGIVRDQGCMVYLSQLLVLKARLLCSPTVSRRSEASAAAKQAADVALRSKAFTYFRQAENALAVLREGRGIGPVFYRTGV